MNNTNTLTKASEVSRLRILSDTNNFSLRDIFECGQCFRFSPLNDAKTAYGGIAHGRYITLAQEPDGIYITSNTDDCTSIWHDYFDLDFDYEACKKTFPNDEHLLKAANAASGIRILHQEHWETLCSFILSQNNNIPRIRSLIEALCKAYGEPFSENGAVLYSFPTAERIASVSENELLSLKMGFRAKYVSDAAHKVASGYIDFSDIEKKDTAEASSKLCEIKGVGPKVASCVLLFSFRKYDCFPIDVWVKRILDKYYPNGTTAEYFGKYAGIAQQYLFHYERNLSSTATNGLTVV